MYLELDYLKMTPEEHFENQKDYTRTLSREVNEFQIGKSAEIVVYCYLVYVGNPTEGHRRLLRSAMNLLATRVYRRGSRNW